MGKRLAYSVAITLFIAALVAFALFLGGIAPTVAQNDGPQMSVTPNQAVANQRISLTATGFTPNSEIGEVAEGEEQVSGISIGGEDIPWDRINGGNTVNLDSGGNWSTSVDLPLTSATTGSGDKTIEVTDAEGVSGTVAITIPSRNLTTTPTSSRVGTLAAIRGENFPGKNDNGSSFSVTITYDTGSEVLASLTVAPDASGDFETQIRIPSRATALTINQVRANFQDDDGVSVENTTNHAVLPGGHQPQPDERRPRFHGNHQWGGL